MDALATINERIGAAEQALAAVGRKDKLAGNVAVGEARRRLHFARERAVAARERLAKLNTLVHELSASHARFQGEPPLEAAALVEWIGEAGKVGDALRFASALVRESETVKDKANRDLETMRGELFAAVNQTFEYTVARWHRQEWAASDLEPAVRDMARGEIRRLRAEWAPVFDQVAAEAAI